MKVKQEIIEARRENETMQASVDMIKQQSKNLQIEKDTKVKAFNKLIFSLTAGTAHTQSQQLNLVQEEINLEMKKSICPTISQL